MPRHGEYAEKPRQKEEDHSEQMMSCTSHLGKRCASFKSTFHYSGEASDRAPYMRSKYCGATCSTSSTVVALELLYCMQHRKEQKKVDIRVAGAQFVEPSDRRSR